MRHVQPSRGVHNWVFEDGEAPFAVEYINTADQESLQLLCSNGEFVDMRISDLGAILADLLEITNQHSLSREVHYRILPGIKEI